MTVAELLDRISAEELEAWRLYDECVEPNGDRRADLRAGAIAATVANTAPMAPGAERKTYVPQDFALRFETEEAPAPEAEGEAKQATIAAKMHLLKAMQNAKAGGKP